MIKTIMPLATVTLSGLARADDYKHMTNSDLVIRRLRRRLQDTGTETSNLETHQDDLTTDLNLNPWATDMDNSDLRDAWFDNSNFDKQDMFVNHIRALQDFEGSEYEKSDVPDYFKSFINDDPNREEFLSELDMSQLPTAEDLTRLHEIYAEYVEYLPQKLVTYLEDGKMSTPKALDVAQDEGIAWQHFEWDDHMLYLLIPAAILIVGLGLIRLSLPVGDAGKSITCPFGFGIIFLTAGLLINGVCSGHKDFIAKGTEWLNDLAREDINLDTTSLIGNDEIITSPEDIMPLDKFVSETPMTGELAVSYIAIAFGAILLFAFVITWIKAEKNWGC